MHFFLGALRANIYILQEIVSDPKFFTAGVSSDDFSQGTLGNCWFVAACACLAEDSKLWKKVCKIITVQHVCPCKLVLWRYYDVQKFVT